MLNPLKGYDGPSPAVIEFMHALGIKARGSQTFHAVVNAWKQACAEANSFQFWKWAFEQLETGGDFAGPEESKRLLREAVRLAMIHKLIGDE